MSDAILPLKMPKWGLSMQEGKLIAWHKRAGDVVQEGDELADIETSKITNVFEAPHAGTIRRIVAAPDETLPVGALLAVIAEPGVADAEIEAFIADYQARFVPEEEGAGGPGPLTAEVGGRTIRYGRQGEGAGAPLVLVHGFGGDLNGWAAIMGPLAAAREVIVLDLPGHGGSTKDVGDGGPETLAQSVLGLMDALGIAAAHLAGHSMGAAVALAAAAAAPARVRSLALIAPAGVPGTAVSEEFVRGFIEARRARDFKAPLEMLFDDPGLVTKDLLEEAVKYKRIDGVDEGLERLASAMAEGAFTAKGGERLKAFKGKVLLFAYAGDRIVGRVDLAALPAGADVTVLEGESHMPQVEAAGKLAERLGAFLEEAD